jgi:ceramide glucosyltransferase
LALLAYGILARAVMAAAVGAFVVEERHLLRTALLYPLRDLMGFFYWAASYANSDVLWRGQVYRLTENGLMLAEVDSTEAERETAMTA